MYCNNFIFYKNKPQITSEVFGFSVDSNIEQLRVKLNGRTTLWQCCNDAEFEQDSKFTFTVYSQCGTNTGKMEIVVPMFTMIRYRYHIPLFPIGPLTFPVPVPVPFPCSVNKPSDCIDQNHFLCPRFRIFLTDGRFNLIKNF